jgi:hypothetical protein
MRSVKKFPTEDAPLANASTDEEVDGRNDVVRQQLSKLGLACT